MMAVYNFNTILNNELDNAYQSGHNTGYELGHQQGYDEGYAIGLAKGSTPATITGIQYTVAHAHVDGCYGLVHPSATAVMDEGYWDDNGNQRGVISAACSRCGYKVYTDAKHWNGVWSYNNNQVSSSWCANNARTKLINSHLGSSSTCPSTWIKSTSPTCGKSVGTRIVTDFKQLGTGDTVSNVSITF